MKFNKENYVKLTTKRAKRTASLKNCAFAFLIGGTICAIGELIYFVFFDLLKFSEKTSSLYVCVLLIGASAVLTCLGVFDDIAKHAGAGTLLPITGFANAMSSASMEFKSEGLIFGTSVKLFSVVGPVIVNGIVWSTVAGILTLLWSMIF